MKFCRFGCKEENEIRFNIEKSLIRTSVADKKSSLQSSKWKTFRYQISARQNFKLDTISALRLIISIISTCLLRSAARFGFVAESLARSLLNAAGNVGRNGARWPQRGWPHLSEAGANPSEVHRARAPAERCIRRRCMTRVLKARFRVRTGSASTVRRLTARPGPLLPHIRAHARWFKTACMSLTNVCAGRSSYRVSRQRGAAQRPRSLV